MPALAMCPSCRQVEVKFGVQECVECEDERIEEGKHPREREQADELERPIGRVT